MTLDTPTTDDCWTDIDDNEDLSIMDIPDENQLIMHEVNNQNTVDVESSASRGLIDQGTYPTPSITSHGSKRRRMTSEALLHDSDSIPLPLAIGQHSEALVFTNDTLPVVPMPAINMASTHVGNPSSPIATASLEDTLSSAETAIGRRRRKRLSLQQSYAAENPQPQMTSPVIVTTVDARQDHSSTPNGTNTIPDATVNLDFNVPDAEPQPTNQVSRPRRR